MRSKQARNGCRVPRASWGAGHGGGSGRADLPGMYGTDGPRFGGADAAIHGHAQQHRGTAASREPPQERRGPRLADWSTGPPHSLAGNECMGITSRQLPAGSMLSAQGLLFGAALAFSGSGRANAGLCRWVQSVLRRPEGKPLQGRSRLSGEYWCGRYQVNCRSTEADRLHPTRRTRPETGACTPHSIAVKGKDGSDDLPLPTSPGVHRDSSVHGGRRRLRACPASRAGSGNVIPRGNR